MLVINPKFISLKKVLIYLNRKIKEVKNATVNIILLFFDQQSINIHIF
jgi:hypothetical protein